LDTGEEEQNRHTGQGNGGAEEARKAPPLLKATSRKTGVGFDGKLKSGGGLERGQSNLGFFPVYFFLGTSSFQKGKIYC
jgi:hypothetical protein